KEAQLEEKNSQVQRLQAEMRNTIRSLLLDGSTPEKVSRLTGMPIKTVHEIEKTIAEESGGN
ncbi:MAG: hypothetical protein Q4D81_07365, partial [Eubacteriales bacterium]|nr:hypothetical protein [Eubacteriales bacterium]